MIHDFESELTFEPRVDPPSGYVRRNKKSSERRLALDSSDQIARNAHGFHRRTQDACVWRQRKPIALVDGNKPRLWRTVLVDDRNEDLVAQRQIVASGLHALRVERRDQGSAIGAYFYVGKNTHATSFGRSNGTSASHVPQRTKLCSAHGSQTILEEFSRLLPDRRPRLTAVYDLR